MTHDGGYVLVWASMAASVTGLFIFIGDIIYDANCRMNPEVYRNILSVNLQKNAFKLIGWEFIMQQDNSTINTANATKKIIREKKGTVLD